ncbi:MAG: ACT domain-containing protein, partial [Deltaproteobacteria bacterium]
MGVSFKDMKLKVGVLGAEPWSNKMRVEIEKKLNIDAIDLYGLSEIIGPGVSSECIEAKDGLHVFEDHFIPEIIDPESGEVLPYGEKGELVFTTITKEAFPVIRYRTKDITSLNPEPCKCGRTHVRMERVSGRTDDMLIIRGVNVFPSQIESVLLEIEKVEPHYQMIVDREGALDILEVRVEVNEKVFSDEIKGLQKLERDIEREIKDLLGVSVTIKLVEPKTIQRSEGKAVRVIEILSDGGVNIRALYLADASDFGVLRFIVNDTKKAKEVLQKNNFTVVKTEVIAVEVPDRPGGLAGILEILKNEDINVEYMYAFVERSSDNAVIIFRFDEIDKAIKALTKNNITVLPGEKVYSL